MDSEISHLKAGEIILYKGGNNTILPADKESEIRINKLKKYEWYSFIVKSVRNYGFHKKFFKLLKTAYDNQDEYKSFVWFRQNVMMGIGYCDTYIHTTGEVMYEIKSVSFKKCTQAKFEKIYNNALTYLMDKYGFDEDFINRLLSFA